MDRSGSGPATTRTTSSRAVGSSTSRSRSARPVCTTRARTSSSPSAAAADKRHLLDRLIAYKASGQSIVGYGAPAKGNTLLNYCGIGTDFLDFTVDISPSKQDRFLPGTHIPIHAPDAIRAARPDLVFVLPWNIEREITETMSYIREWAVAS